MKLNFVTLGVAASAIVTFQGVASADLIVQPSTTVIMPGASMSNPQSPDGSSSGPVGDGGGIFGTAISQTASLQVSSCTEKTISGGGNPGPSFDCDLFPTTNGTTLNDIVTGITFPNDPNGDNPGNDPVSPGYVVLVKPGSVIDPVTGEDLNQSDWTQVLQFVPNAFQQAVSMNLYTLGCNDAANPNDDSCFPSVTAVTTAAYFFDDEPSSGVYVYDADDQRDHTYTLNFVAEPAAAAPEPATVSLIAFGLIALVSTRIRSRISGE